MNEYQHAEGTESLEPMDKPKAYDHEIYLLKTGQLSINSTKTVIFQKIIATQLVLAFAAKQKRWF